MNRTRIGLIGCGAWGRHILRDLTTLGCHVTVVSRSKTSHDNAIAGKADQILDCMTQLTSIDGVIVATPSSTHAAVIEQISRLQIPIFVEKPMTAQLADAERLASQLADRLFVMHKWRYHAGVHALAGIVAQRELGDILGLRTSRTNWGNHHRDVDMIWTCLPHDLSIAIEILGYIPKPRFSVALEWQDETVELIGFLGERPWHVIEISSVRPDINREIRLECRDGIAVLKDGYVEHIEIYRKTNWGLEPAKYTERRSFILEMPLLCELREFVHYLQGGAKPKCNADEGLAVVRAITELRKLAGIEHSGILQSCH